MLEEEAPFKSMRIILSEEALANLIVYPHVSFCEA